MPTPVTASPVTASSVTVRGAHPDDHAALMVMLEEFARQFATRIPLWPKDRDVAELIVADMILGEQMQVAEVLEGPRAGELVGLVASVATPHPFNPGILVLAETLWWVDPLWREMGVGRLLLEALEARAEALGADWVTLSLLHSSPELETALRGRGYQPWEKSYLLQRR